MEIYSEIEVLQSIASKIPDWSFNREDIFRDFTFSSYLKSLEFVSQVGKLAEDMDHHPTIHIFWKKVRILTHTHSVQSISDLDFELAVRIDQIFNSF